MKEKELQAKSKLSAFKSILADDSRQHGNRNPGRDTKYEPLHSAILTSQEEHKMVLLLLMYICIKHQPQNTSPSNTSEQFCMLIEQGI